MALNPGRVVDGLRHRLQPSAEHGATSLWPWPVAAGIIAVVVALALTRWGPAPESDAGRRLWPGGQEAAQVLLQVVVASVVTATSITFSLVVVALQVASQQFSPRLLRGFSRDPVLKVVLAVLVGTFAYSITLLRSAGGSQEVPPLAMLGTYLSALASLGALLVFINHMATAMRVDTMMVSVHSDSRRGIARFYPAYEERLQAIPAVPPRGAVVVPSRRSGFVRRIDVPTLADHARRADLVFVLEVRPGDHVVVGTPVAAAWSLDGPTDLDEATDIAERGIEIGYERTLEQDPSFGFRKLADIAVKALSPSINDPVTATHAVGHMGDLLVRLTGRRLGPQPHDDDDGTLRVVTVDRDFRYYLDLACGQVRRYGAREPTVLIGLLRMLRDVAVSARDDLQRDEIRRQVRLVVGAVPPDELLPEDARDVHDMAQRVEEALHGHLVQAFRDRSGETRSV